MNWETLLAWGDSITIGARSYLAYPEYAGQILKERTDKHWHTPIHAVCGYTTSDLNRSLTPQMSAMTALAPSVLTIMIGTNDLKSATPSSAFAIAYEQILIKARMVLPSSQIIVLPIPEMVPGVMYPYRYSMNGDVRRLNDIITSLAAEHAIRTLSGSLPTEQFFDGVHLNEVGSRAVGQRIAEQVFLDRGLDEVDLLSSAFSGADA